MQQPAALFHEVEDMLRKLFPVLALLPFAIGLLGFDGCKLTPTMEEVPEAETEVKEEASSSDELADALELAREFGALIVESNENRLVVCFDNEELLRAFIRRVNQATETLIALDEGLCATITVQ